MVREPTVIIDGRLLAYRHGGIQRYTRGLLAHLPEAAPEFRVVVAQNRSDAPIPTAINRTRVFTPPHHRLERFALGAELTARRPALVHSPDFVAPIGIGFERVATIHDLAFLKDPSLLSSDARRYYAQVRASAERAALLIAVSETTASDIVRLLNVRPERVRVVYNGIDDAFFQVSDQCLTPDEEHRLPEPLTRAVRSDRPIVLAVGTVEPRKRHTLLLDAFEQPQWQRDMAPLLVLVGQPGWRCREIVTRIGLAEKKGGAIWLRDVDDVTLRMLYRVASLLAIPSLDEGFGLPAVEAMASGLPVVSSTGGALPEILDDAGVMVDSDDPLAWAEALQYVLGDSDYRAQLAGRGRLRARRFRWSTAAEATADVYREVMGS